jgi:uncharacterized repeat protein (TIGR01451 family)
MSGRTVVLSSLALAIVGIAVSVQAQQSYSRDDDWTSSTRPQSKTIFDRMEEFGRDLFGGGTPAQKEPTKKTRSTQGSTSSRSRYAPSVSDEESRPASSRAGSISRAPSQRSASSSRSAEAESDLERSRNAYTRSYRTAAERDEASYAYRSAQSKYRVSPDEAEDSRESARSRINPAQDESPALSAESPRPLYERMNAARRSAFGNAPSITRRESSIPTPSIERSLPRDSAAVESSQPARVIKGDATPAEPTPVIQRETRSNLDAPLDWGPTPANSQPASTAASNAVPPAADPPPSQTSPATKATEPTPVAAPTEMVPATTPAAEPVVKSAPAAKAEPAAKSESVVKAEPVVKNELPDRGDVLLARRSPNLSVETIGPRRISVGKESKYELTIVNSGEVSVEELLVTVDLPTWAEVAGSEPSVGQTQTVAAGVAGRQLQWKLLRLDAKSRERLVLRIVPRESRPFDLGVKWTYRQSASQAMIEVQEPKLTLNLEGPREVLFGKKEMYKLRVANTGNGDAENVVIKLYPVGAGQGAAASHNFGTVPAGQERSIEIELTARQTGTLAVKMEVTCDGAARVELAEKVVVRRAALELEIGGPKRQYVDAPVAYRLRVSNSGNAAAADVLVTAVLPSSMKFQSASDDGQVEADGRQIRWKLDVLRPGAEKTLDLKCVLVQAGPARLQVDCASEDLAATAVAVTDVDAMADLVMDVTDPAGPVAVGQEATYEIRVHNRGSKAAEELELVAFFSQGIEPVNVEGADHKISLGQVSFPRIAAVAPGADVRLKIRAKAQVAGNHVFRAELQCRPLGTRLAAEETTYYYGGSAAPEVLARSGDTAAPRTADRRADTPATVPAGSQEKALR